MRDLTAYRDESRDIQREHGLEPTLGAVKCPRCHQVLLPGFVREDHEGRLEPPTIREVYRCYDCAWWSDVHGVPPGSEFATVIHRVGKVKITQRDKVLEDGN